MLRDICEAGKTVLNSVRGPVRIGVLVSGGGTNLQAIIDAQKKGQITSGKVELVVSANSTAYALTRAENEGIKHETVDRGRLGSEEAFEAALLQVLKDNNIEFIVLAGFLSMIGPKIIREFPNRIINIHPSLIPSFCGSGYYGLKVHEAALAKGVKVTGATVHFVNEKYDDGEIIAQKAIYVEKGDTAAILQKRVMEQAEWIILPQSVEQISKEILTGGIR